MRLLTVVLATAVAASASGATLLMPQDLVELAEQNGCSQIEDFFEGPGESDPPYIYGYLPGPQESSAVFWCKKKNPAAGEEKPYVLLIAAFDGATKSACPTRIEWWNPPRGLSLYRGNDLALDEFQYLDDYKKNGPKKTLARGPVIVASRDGVSAYFYCHGNKWLYKILH